MLRRRRKAAGNIGAISTGSWLAPDAPPGIGRRGSEPPRPDRGQRVVCPARFRRSACRCSFGLPMRYSCRCGYPDPTFALTVPANVQAYLVTGRPIIAMLDGEGARIVAESGAGLTCGAGDASALASRVLRTLRPRSP